MAPVIRELQRRERCFRLTVCATAQHRTLLDQVVQIFRIPIDFDLDVMVDDQTLEGKTPAGVAGLARKLGKRVFAIVGRADANSRARDLFDGVYELGGPIPEAKKLLRERARQLGIALKR